MIWLDFNIAYICCTIATFVMMVIIGSLNVSRIKDIPAFILMFFFSDFGFPFICVSVVYWVWRILK